MYFNIFHLCTSTHTHTNTRISRPSYTPNTQSRYKNFFFAFCVLCSYKTFKIIIYYNCVFFVVVVVVHCYYFNKNSYLNLILPNEDEQKIYIYIYLLKHCRFRKLILRYSTYKYGLDCCRSRRIKKPLEQVLK